MVTKNTRYLKNKRVLITAGPTWVPIDTVRVISNIATGETGILLAEKLQKLGARVTLLLGPVAACCLNKKITVVRFKFFDELKNSLTRELKTKKYDIIIHSAAVSDFRPQARFKGKLESGKAHSFKLLPLPKIIHKIRRLAPESTLIPFKLESAVSGAALIKEAKTFLSKVKGEFIVANTLYPYRAFLIDSAGNTVFTANNKIGLVKKLSRTLNSEPSN